MKLTVTGLKGSDHALELGRLNMVVAPNGAGKSTITDAIRLLALGYVPALGKRLVDSAALIRTGKAEVRLDFDAKEKSI